MFLNIRGDNKMELVYVSIISGIFGLIGLLLWDRSKDKRYTYELKRFSKQKRAQKELKSLELAPRSVPTLKDDAINRLIEKYAPQLLGGESSDYGDLAEAFLNSDVGQNIIDKVLGANKENENLPPSR
jgi:hypothetical protein